MSKSDGNTILPQELFEGTSPLIEASYSPMTLRFAMLQTHYRSTMDISEAALRAARKGYIKLMNGLLNLERLAYPTEIEPKIDANLSRILEVILSGFTAVSMTIWIRLNVLPSSSITQTNQ